MTPDYALTPELLLAAYAQGIFPMAESRDGALHWFSPDPRTILPLDTFRMRRSLAKRVRQQPYDIQLDSAFAQVIRSCAEPTPQRPETWINDDIIDLYTQLHAMGFAHSVEAYTCREDGSEPTLVGGLYGVTIGGAFFGESMFSRAVDASKICLVHLVEHLRAQGYLLLDVQLTNPHLEQFGIVEIARSDYLKLLERAINSDLCW